MQMERMRSLSMEKSVSPNRDDLRSELRFEGVEAPLLFPLGGGLLAGVEEGLAGGVGVVGAELLAAAGCGSQREHVGRCPEAGAGQEVVFHAGACELLEVGIAEVVVERGAGVLMCDLDAADAFIVSGERDGHVGGAIERERMFVADDAEDA